MIFFLSCLKHITKVMWMHSWQKQSLTCLCLGDIFSPLVVLEQFLLNVIELLPITAAHKFSCLIVFFPLLNIIQRQVQNTICAKRRIAYPCGLFVVTSLLLVMDYSNGLLIYCSKFNFSQQVICWMLHLSVSFNGLCNISAAICQQRRGMSSL